MNARLAVVCCLALALLTGCSGSIREKKLFDADEITSRADMYRRTGRTEDARRELLKAFALAKGTDSRKEVGRICNDIATVDCSDADFESALKYLQQAEEIFRKEDCPEWLATTLGNIGCVYMAMNKLDLALPCYEEALQWDEKAKNRRGRADRLNYLGILNRKLGNIDKAMNYLNEALSINKSIKNEEGMAANLCNLASIFEAKGDPDKAITFYEEALEIDKRLQNFGGVATELSNIAHLYENMGKIDHAIEYNRRAEDVNILISRDDRAAQDRENIERLLKRKQGQKKSGKSE